MSVKAYRAGGLQGKKYGFRVRSGKRDGAVVRCNLPTAVVCAGCTISSVVPSLFLLSCVCSAALVGRGAQGRSTRHHNETDSISSMQDDAATLL